MQTSALVAIPILFAAALPGQLSGVYTVDANGSGPRNFSTITAAVHAAWSQGLAGRTELQLAPGAYGEQVFVVPIRGMSKATPLVFTSSTPLQAIMDRRFSLQLGSSTLPVEGVVFDGLTFRGSNSGIDGNSPSRDIEIVRSRFEASNAVTVSGATDWDVHHNVFSGSPGVFVIGSEGCQIHHNELRGMTGIDVRKTPFALSNRRTRIYNNFISTTMWGIDLDPTAYNVEIAHNTVAVKSTNSASFCVRASGGFFTLPIRIHGNILVYDGPVACMQLAEDNPYRFELDSNLYFAPRANQLLLVDRRPIVDLAAWQTAGWEPNSIQADPQLVGGSALTDLHIKPTSPALDRAVATPSYVTDDFDGQSRDRRPDIGADEVVNAFQPYGTGCAGSGNIVPKIGHTGTGAIGSSNFAVTLSNALAGPGVSAFFILGVSDKTWGAIPLPFSFGGGCALQASAELLVRSPVTGLPGPGNGAATIGIPIPNDPRLVGVRTFFQWAVVDPAAAGIGLAFSDAAVLTL